MAVTKKTEIKAVEVKEAVKPVAEAKAAVEAKSAAEVKPTVAAEKAPVVQEEKAAEVKKAAPQRAASKRTAASKKAEPTKKTPVRKAAEKKEIQTSVFIQYGGKETAAADLLAAAKKAYLAAGHKEDEIQSMEVYVKPEEGAAYYAVNGVGSEEYKIVY